MSASKNAGILEGNDPEEVVFMPEISAERLTSMNEEQKGLILSMRHMQINTSLVGENPKLEIGDMVPSATLFSENMVALPVLFNAFRDFADRRGGNLQQYSSRSIMMTLATSLYEEAEDKTTATEIVTVLLAAGCHLRCSGQKEEKSDGHVGSVSDTASPPSASLNNIAHNVAMRLKDKEKKFTVSLEESWMEFVDEYLQIC